MNVRIFMSIFLAQFLYCVRPVYSVSASQTEIKVDLLIYGGTSAGVIAAYSARKLGKTVLLVENSKHLGGMTSGGLSATDIGNKIAITGLSRDFFRRLGNHYSKFEHWLPEPHVAEKIFNEYIKESSAQVLYETRLSYVQKDKNKLISVILESVKTPSDTRTTVFAKQFMDCSYEGDLMAMAGVSFTVGREDNRLYNETLSGVQKQDRHQFEEGIDPWKEKGNPNSGLLWGISPYPVVQNGTGDAKVQAYNFRLCMTYDSLNRIPFTKPDNYDPSRYELLIRLMNSRKEKGWQHLLKSYFLINEIPNKKADWNNMGAFSTDFIGANWSYPTGSYEERARIWKAHEDYQKGLLYFVANDPRILPEVQAEIKRWGFPKDEFQENGGWPYQLYVREARRMVGEYVMTEHNCRGIQVVEDGVGMAAYTMDSHNCDRHFVGGMVKNEGNVEVGGFPPYPISFRAIVPKREECSNLTVPVCMSATHIAYGSIRMEPVFMVLAQSAAIAACMAIDRNIPVQMVDVVALQSILNENPLLNGVSPEVLIDDFLHPEKITYSGKWKIGEGNISKYGRSVQLGEDSPETRVRFSHTFAKPGTYNLLYYFPKFWSPIENADSVEISVFDGKSKIVKVMHLQEKAMHSNDNKGNWISVGTFSVKANAKTWVEVAGLKVSNAKLPADAVLWVPGKKN